MIRISTIFIAICMVLVAASLGLILYSLAGISGMESAIVALTALTFLILYNAVSMRLRDRTDVGGQIADLSRGTADLARQVAEFGRRLATIEGKMVSAHSAGAERIQAVAGEINELGLWSSSSRCRSPITRICLRPVRLLQRQPSTGPRMNRSHQKKPRVWPPSAYHRWPPCPLISHPFAARLKSSPP